MAVDMVVGVTMQGMVMEAMLVMVDMEVVMGKDTNHIEGWTASAIGIQLTDEILLRQQWKDLLVVARFILQQSYSKCTEHSRPQHKNKKSDSIDTLQYTHQIL